MEMLFAIGFVVWLTALIVAGPAGPRSDFMSMQADVKFLESSSVRKAA